MSDREDETNKKTQRDQMAERKPMQDLPRIKVRPGAIGPKPKIKRKPASRDESEN
jgi:hypothetical protein